MKIHIKYAYSEHSNRNCRIYPSEVLKKAFNEPIFKKHCLDKAIPVTSEDDKLIGMGTAALENDRVVSIEAEIFDSTYIKILKEFKDNNLSFTLVGTGSVEYIDDKATVTEVHFTHAMFTRYPTVDIKEIKYKD